MSEIKYEIIKKIGVLSSPLRPSPYEDLRRTLTAPTPLHFGDASASLRVRCPPNQNPIWGKPGFESFLQNGLCGWRAIIGIKNLPILGRLEGQGLNREPKYDLRDRSADREKMGKDQPPLSFGHLPQIRQSNCLVGILNFHRRIWGRIRFGSFLTSRFFGLLTIDRIKSLPILGRLEG